MKTKIKKKRILEIIKEEINNLKKESLDMGTPQDGQESSIQTSLHMIQEYSTKLIEIQDNVQWEDWMQDKLTLASRDLDSIYHKFEGEMGGQELAPKQFPSNLRNATLDDLPSLEETENDYVPISDYLEGSEVNIKKINKFIAQNRDQTLPAELVKKIKVIFDLTQSLESSFIDYYKDDYDEDDYDLESLYERELTDFEKNSKEKYVKSLKKGIKDFKNKYGKDWKSVMYGTATNMAKK